MRTRLIDLPHVIKKELVIYIFVIVLVIVGVVFNVISLFSQSIRLDESQSILFSIKPALSVLNTVAHDVHVPLYNMLLHFWMQLFGTNIIYARLLSLLFFIATLPVLYLVAKEVSSKRVAFLTVALFALSPFISWFSHETRMYTLFILVTCLHHLFFLKLLKRRTPGTAFGLFFSTILGAYTHYFFSFLIITQCLYLLVTYINQIGSMSEHSFLGRIFSRSHPFRSTLIMYSITIASAYLFFLPWVAYVLMLGGAASTKPLILAPTTYNLLQTFILFIFGNQSQTIQALLVALWPISVLLLFFVFTHKKNISAQRLEYFMMATFFPVILMFVVSYIYPIFLPRYLIFITPTLFFLLAWLMVNYSKKTSAVVTLLVVAIMFSFSIYQTVSTDTPVKENYKGVASLLSEKVTASDIVLVTPPFTTYPIEYQYTGKARIETIPAWNRYDEQSTLPQFSLPEFQKQMAEYTNRYTRAFVVFSYNQGYEDRIQNYLEMNYLREDQQILSHELEVRVYKLRYLEKNN